MKIALLWRFEPVGRWFLTVLLLWAAVQFFCHEYFTLFGASENRCSFCFAVERKNGEKWVFPQPQLSVDTLNSRVSGLQPPHRIESGQPETRRNDS